MNTGRHLLTAQFSSLPATATTTFPLRGCATLFFRFQRGNLLQCFGRDVRLLYWCTRHSHGRRSGTPGVPCSSAPFGSEEPLAPTAPITKADEQEQYCAVAPHAAFGSGTFQMGIRTAYAWSGTPYGISLQFAGVVYRLDKETPHSGYCSRSVRIAKPQGNQSMRPAWRGILTSGNR